MTNPPGRRPGERIISRYADIVRLLLQQPRTLQEIIDLTGAGYDSADNWMLALTEEKLVARHRPPRVSGRVQPYVYTWVGLGE